MCGRFALVTDLSSLVDHFNLNTTTSAVIKPRYNLAPNQFILMIKDRRLQFIEWGSNNCKMINIRSETLQKTCFKKNFLLQRCLIPASGFYIWKKMRDHKQPFYCYLEIPLYAFAGMIVKQQAVIITKPGGTLISERSPVIPKAEYYEDWLTGKIIELTPEQQHQEAELRCHPVTTVVNNPKIDTPACILSL